MIKKLKQLEKAGRKVRVTRRFSGDPHHTGFILKVSNHLVVIQRYHDFYREGYVILRIEDLATIRSGKYERHWEKMLAAEGLIGSDHVLNGIDITGMRSALETLSQHYSYIAVKCECEEEENDEFYIGKIVSLGYDTFKFIEFDALGYWADKLVEIGIHEVTQVQFDTPYINIFSKYLQNQPPSDLF